MTAKSLSEIAAILGTSVEDEEISGFAIDSKNVKKGDLFFALKGKKFDGHHFLSEVKNRGGVAAVVDKEYHGPTFGLKLIRVDEVVSALQTLATEVHKKQAQRVIAITGSVGKTTTKEFLATLLEGKYRVAKTPGNANSQVGLPLALLNGEGTEEILVVEMGMTEAGELKKLLNIVPPDIALITRIGRAHVGFFSDGIEGIAREKLSIFSHPKTKLKIANLQVCTYISEQTAPFVQKNELKTFSLDQEGVYWKLQKGYCIVEGSNESPRFEPPFQEVHFLENLLAAISVARALGMSWEEIIPRIASLKYVERRFERIEKEGVVYINDTYNASPEAVRSALLALEVPPMGGKTIMVFGGMGDLGSFSEEIHKEIAELARTKIDHLLLVDKDTLPMIPLFEEAKKAVEFFSELKSLKQTLESLVKKGDVVLVKGKNTSQLWTLF